MVRPGGLSRDESFVSTLSDEVNSSRGGSVVVTPLEEGGSGSVSGQGASTQSENGDGDGDGEVEELKCRKCGGEKFVMVKRGSVGVGGGGSKGGGLKCRACGWEVS